MAAASIAGINVKIGADLSELKKEVGKVGDTVEQNISPAQATVKTLADNFKSAATKAGQVATKVISIANQVAQIASSLKGFVSGALEAALAVNPETAEKVQGIKDSFNDIKASFGEALVPLIDKYAPQIVNVLDSIAGWIADHPEAAANIVGIGAALAGLATVMGAALPVITLFNAGMITISAPALAAATAIAGLVTIIGLLISRMDDVSTYTVATAEGIENMDTATQSLVQNGYGDLEIWDKPIFTNDEGVTGYYSDVMGWDGLPIFVEVQQDVADAVSMTTDAVEGQTTAMETAADSITETKTASEEAQEVLKGMQEAIDGVSQTTSTDLTESMDQINEILESDAFKQFSSQPISEDVSESWTTFGTAVGTATEGFTSMTETLSEESAFSIGLSALPAKLDSIRTSAESLGGYLSGGFVTAINILLTFLCMTTTDEEGNTSAGGGNTLFNALGSIYGLFQDIYATSQLLAQYWTGTFVSASVAMRNEAGTATNVVEALGIAAQSTAQHFAGLAAQIYSVIDAYLDLMRVKGGGGGGGTGKSTDLFKASGGPVSAGSPYVVGELGPEIFIPSTSGTIIPNDRVSAGGPTVNVIFQGQVIGDERTISAYVTKACNKAIKEAVYAGA